MTLLNNADALKVGTQDVLAAHVGRTTVWTPAPVVGPLAVFAHPNSVCALSMGNTRATHNGGAGDVANCISDAAILEPTYFELRLHHSGAGYIGGQLYAEAENTLIDYAVLGQWYDKNAVYSGPGDRYSISILGFWGKTEQINSNIALGDWGDSPFEVVLQFAVSGRDVWIRSDVEPTWWGGGDPVAGTDPSFVMLGSEPIRFGAATNNTGNHATILDPADYVGTAPSGFRLGVAAPPP